MKVNYQYYCRKRGSGLVDQQVAGQAGGQRVKGKMEISQRVRNPSDLYRARRQALYESNNQSIGQRGVASANLSRKKTAEFSTDPQLRKKVKIRST